MTKPIHRQPFATLHCATCNEDRRMRQVARGCCLGAFGSLFLLITGFPLILLLPPLGIVFVIVGFIGLMAQRVYWRCETCGSLIPKG